MVRETKDIVVGDVGGTNVRLAIARVSDHGVELSSIWKQAGENFPTFMGALGAFLAEGKANVTGPSAQTTDGAVVQGGQAAGAAIGLAGPVSGGRVELLHRDWTIDAKDIGERIGSEAVMLVNDFVAMARSAPELGSDELVELSGGDADPQGDIVVGGPGTGFGLGILKHMRTASGQSGWIVVGGEGGHQIFAPQSELEWKVAQHLRGQGVYVSNEVIASGSGFVQTLRALGEVMGLGVATTDPTESLANAKAGDQLALEMCRLRARCTMSALGDAALAANATGGVFIAGGVSAYLTEWLTEPAALACFRERGPRSALLANIPIRLITGDKAALIGAAALWRDQRERGWI